MKKPNITRVQFADKCTPEPNTGCWLWNAGYGKNGYGGCWWDGRANTAHRVSYLLHRGEIPEGMFVCHRCDTRGCVNPEHLFLGTALDNSRDMVAKGRYCRDPERFRKTVRTRAERGYFKLTEDDVREIRRKRPPSSEIVVRYGVDRSTANMVLRGATWKHVVA